MIYKLNNKNIRIPDNEIENLCKVLKVSKEEAVTIWLEDNDYLVNDEQNALDKKAKDSQITQTIHQAKNISRQKSQKERVKKEDIVKKDIISKLSSYLAEFATDINVENDSKIITFIVGNDKFKLDLVRTRAKKE